MSSSRWITGFGDARELRLAIVATAIFTCLFVVLVVFSRGNVVVLAVFPLIVVFLVSILNYELSLYLLVVVLFGDYYTIGLSSAVLFSFVLGLSFLLKTQNLEWKQFWNPLAVPIMIYGISILPSFWNATQPLLSAYKLLNVIGFLIILFTMVAANPSLRVLRAIMMVYLLMTVFNSIDVIRLSIVSARRPFGFAGIWFVDYSALGVCLCIASALVTRGRGRFLFLLGASVIALALILTETRNTWVSAFLTLLGLATFLIIDPRVLGLSRRYIFKMMSFASVAMLAIVLIALQINPRFARRTSQLTQAKDYSISESGEVGNSLISRLLIWDTAFQAFKAHPMVGVGVYGFPYSSQNYYRIPRFLFRLYVEGSHPHQTYLAVLTETGLLGMVGFLIFIGSAIKFSFRSIYLAHHEVTRRFALVSFVGLIYCMTSMFFTDAWLWGQQIALLGLTIGSSLVIYKRNLQTEVRSLAI